MATLVDRIIVTISVAKSLSSMARYILGHMCQHSCGLSASSILLGSLVPHPTVRQQRQWGAPCKAHHACVQGQVCQYEPK